MKKNLLIAVLVVFTLTANAQSRWSVGVQSGLLTNVAKFSSGDENANALFSNQPYKTAHLGVSFRYRLCDNFSLQSGFTFTEFGFTYSIAKDYSLLKPEKHFSEINTSTCMSGIPAMFIFNSKLNCTNTRIVAGAGFILRGIDGEWKSENQTEVTITDARTSETIYLNEQSKSTSSLSSAVTWMVGLEKVFAKGNMISMTFQAQQGFNKIAESTVSYTANGEDYMHTFINRGSTAAFCFTYSFQPIGSRKANKAQLLKGVN